MFSPCGGLLALAALSVAAPTSDNDKRATLKENFYLFGTPIKSTAAANATALDLVSPYYQPNYLLRMMPGSAPYETFNLTKGVLSTFNSPHANPIFVEYDSNLDPASGSLFFLRGNGTHGLFEFKKGFLAYKGDADHWTRCIGELMQPVINYNGSDPTCTRVYVFQQA